MLEFDNGLEYLSFTFIIFCISHGIIYQTSYVVTSQQNGVVEIKNKRLLDVACTIMFIMQIPFCF